MRSSHFVFLVLVLTLTTGCSLFSRSSPQEAPSPVETVEEPRPAAEAPLARLLPAADLHMRVRVQDEGKAPYEVEEEWVREGTAMLATYSGNPYVRWEVNEEGLWRLDPKGGGALLRYLPPVLTDGAAWRQQSGDATVWFGLTRLESTCDNGASQKVECWELTMLNRDELLTYRFAESTGPVYARSRNEARPADSFVKSLTSTRPGRLEAGDRAKLLTALPVSAPPAPVKAATQEEFQRAATHLIERIGRQGIGWFLGRIQAGHYALPPYGKGVRVATWKPDGFSGWRELSDSALEQTARTLFHGAQVTVKGYTVERWDETNRLLASATLSGVNDGDLAGSGTVVIQLAQTLSGDWQWLLLGTDDGALTQSLTGSPWKAYE
ncbi:MAG: hypothetical protein ACOY94_22550 [Bacillota bacterium]